MNEPYLTWAEIEAKYLNQWVLIAEPKINRRDEVVGGHVVLHFADRVEFLRRVAHEPEIPGVKMYAVRYVGIFPEEEDEIIPVEPEMARK